MAVNDKDNPDANCLPMGLTQFHMHGQPREIMQDSRVIAIMYEANYGLRYIYIDGRTLPAQSGVNPFWYRVLGGTLGRRHARRRNEQPEGRRNRALGRVARRARQPVFGSGKVHRALPAAEIREARNRHHDRGREGVQSRSRFASISRSRRTTR